VTVCQRASERRVRRRACGRNGFACQRRAGGNRLQAAAIGAVALAAGPVHLDDAV